MAIPLLVPAQLGRLLQSARKSQGLTQADVGARVGLSQKRISAIEIDPGSVTVEQLLKLCSALGLEVAIGPRLATAAAQAASRRKVEW